MMKRLIVIFGMVVVLMGFMTPASQADPMAYLRLTSGASQFTIADGSLLDSNPLLGVVTYIGSVGDWDLNVTTGATYPYVGTSALPHLDLNTISGSPGTALPLTLEFSQYYLNWPTANPNIPMSFDIGGTMGGLTQVEASAWYEAHPYVPLGSASYFNHVSQIGTTMYFNSSPFSGSTSGLIVDGFDNHFTVTEFILLTPGTGKILASFDAELHPVPEPVSLLLLGLGLLGLAGIRRKFKSSKS